MILSSDELEILEYLKSWKGTPISMVEISRCAGGRRKFRETPHWAKGLMSRLVEAKMVVVNDRGHYRSLIEEEPADAPTPPPKPAAQSAPKAKLPNKEAHTVGDDYFPAESTPPGKAYNVVGDDYFPSEADAASADRWVAPHLAEILKKSGRKFGTKPGK